MNLNKYKHDDWVVYFSGDKWSPLGFSSWVKLFTRRPFSDDLDYFVNQTIMVWDGESTTNYVRESERKKFGQKVVKKVLHNPNYVNIISKGFETGTDFVLSKFREKKRTFTYEGYEKYNRKFLIDYYPYHIKVKNVVDFLPEKIMKKYLPRLEKARLYAEPVFSQEIGFMNKIAKYISKISGYAPELILHCHVDELTAYWRDGKKLPSKKKLIERSKGSIIFFEQGKITGVLTGNDISKFATIFNNKKKTDILKGQSAFNGKAKGTVRIVFDPSTVKKFNEGDILVAPWTRPEYLPIMKKAGAFVTDGGCILSHAAIVARELKKPCVIATNTATKDLKDGDMVEVDANAATVKIIK